MSTLTISADGKSAAWTPNHSSHRIDYKIVNGTAYHLQTADELVNILEICRAGRTRVEIRYGNDLTGRDWMDRNCGLLGRSTGQLQVPIILQTKRSTGGDSLLDHCIVKLIDMKDGAVLWCHPLYNIENSDEPADEPISSEPQFDRFDVCEAYYILECDYNVSGWIKERPSNRRRNMSTGFQLSRMKFKPRPSLGSFDDLTPNGQLIYRMLESRYGFDKLSK